MEKELPPPDSLTTVNMKPEYAPSDTYSASEPPPAYQRPKAASVQVARIIAVTVVLVSFILGGCILASAYITANASCRHLEEEIALLTETMDRYQPLQAEALVQDEPQQLQQTQQQSTEPNTEQPEQPTMKNLKSTANDDDSDSSDNDDESVHIRLPLSLDLNDLANAMVRSQRSRMNCVVEKKRAAGESIAIFCETGVQQQQQQQLLQEDNSETSETIMVQPVMLPFTPTQQQSSSQLPPNQILHHIAQQIIAQKLQREALLDEIHHNELRQQQQQQQQQQHHIPLPMPIPEDVLSQLDRLPGLPHRNVIVAVQQQQRQSAQGMNGRQTYANARGLPIDIPVPMMMTPPQQLQEEEERAPAGDDQRPHYVHPRSVRSVRSANPNPNPFQAHKRAKRCNCDCAC